MGGGRKSETFIMSEGSSYSSQYGTETSNFSMRNMYKIDLAGVIFGCKNHTISECLAKQIFGLPRPHICYVRNIQPGMPLFLFNYNDRMLHGVYESASDGQLNIDPYAWTDDGGEKTAFPAQVRIRIKTYCQPIPENKFQPVIKDNYFTPSHFHFELDHKQVKRLQSLFSPTPQPRKIEFPLKVNLIGSLVNTKSFAEKVKSTGISTKDSNSTLNFVSGNKYASLFSEEWENDLSHASKASLSTTENDGTKETVSDWEVLCLDGKDRIALDNNNHDPEENPTLLQQQANKSDIKADSERILEKLKKLVSLSSNPTQLASENGSLPVAPCLEKGESEVNTVEPKEELQAEKESEKKNVSSNGFCPENPEVVQTLKDLKVRTMILETKLIETERELEQVRYSLKNSVKTNQRLQERVRELETKSDPSVSLVEDLLDEPPVEHNMQFDKLVYLIGGYNGAWLSALDSYSPSIDILTPHRPMSCSRSYAAATTLNGCLFVFGGQGGGENSWYSTVECYNPILDMWTLCPPLARGNGSLAGVTMQGKLFAIGGGNGDECFSNVEMFDPSLGRWIYGQTMLQKRFAPAASELNGVIYAVGGFDGKGYLNSAERYDPREASWTRLPSMSSRRGCHSVAVLHEKLYVLGGYDGERMVSSMEVFDPRAGSWMTGEPMNCNRGYAGVAVVGGFLYAIGGVQEEGNIVDTVECYQEGAGWMTTNLKGVEKRAFFSALVL